jgi:hypothetical protein
VDAVFTRRSFLAAAAGAATALGAAACSKSSGVIHVGAGNAAQLNLLLTSGAVDGSSDQAVSVFVAGVDQRVAFVLSGKSGFLAPAPGSVTLQFGPDDKHFGPAVPVEVHTDTGASASTYMSTSYQFPKPGTYWLRVTHQGQSADSPVVAIDQRDAMIPRAGQPLISTPTPTKADARGVNPICTLTPNCPFHEISLDAAIETHTPIALMFATPALCETATCGPVLDTLVQAAASFGTRITVVHSEIFTALSRNAPNTPAVLAYHLQSEPLLFLADAKGTVVERVDGLFGRAEVTSGLTRLVG